MKRCIAAILLVMLSACYNGPGTDSRTTSASSTDAPRAIPSGFTGLPDGVLAEPNSYAGIYSDAALVEPCCWMQQRAQFQTIVKSGATRVRLRVRIPDLSVFKRKHQSVIARVDTSRPAIFNDLRPGTHELDVPIPSSNAPTTRTVYLQMGFAFVPKAINLNPDTRALAIYLVRVASN